MAATLVRDSGFVLSEIAHGLGVTGREAGLASVSGAAGGSATLPAGSLFEAAGEPLTKNSHLALRGLTWANVG